MKSLKFAQEYMSLFDIVGNGYRSETCKIEVQFNENCNIEFYYSEDLSYAKIADREFKITSFRKIFCSEKILFLEQQSNELIGNIIIPFWNKSEYKLLCTIVIGGRSIICKRIKDNYWEYSLVLEEEGILQTIKFNRTTAYKMFEHVNHINKNYYGHIDLQDVNEELLMFGLYCIELLFKKLDSNYI